jgi:hypothetical protein
MAAKSAAASPVSGFSKITENQFTQTFENQVKT